MRKIFCLLIISAICSASVPETVTAQDTQQMHDLADAYMRQAMKRLEREERREQRQDAEELRRAQLPDLSQFGTPVEGDTRRGPAQRRSIDCTTVDMGGGDSATQCD